LFAFKTTEKNLSITNYTVALVAYLRHDSDKKNLSASRSWYLNPRATDV